jgi:thioredoxin-like negative regulator of GroEL
MRVRSALVVAAGCAGACLNGRSALGQGRSVEAAERFEQALAREPENLDAVVGLGLARSRLDTFDEAAELLDRAPRPRIVP